MKLVRNTDISRVYEYIRTHPGCARKDVLSIFPPGTRPGNVGIHLFHLQKHHAIENRGGNTRSARWYAIEYTTNQKYLDLAKELMDELEVVHPAIREVYLARRLEEICE